jgi:hypothetical protein
VEQESQKQPDFRDQKITELEAELKRANQVIDNLQKHNRELKQQVAESPSNASQPATFVVKNNAADKPQNRTKRTVVTGSHIRKSRLSDLTPLQYYGLIALVVIGILGLFGLGSLLAYKQNSKNPKALNNPQIKPPNNLPT